MKESKQFAYQEFKTDNGHEFVFYAVFSDQLTSERGAHAMCSQGKDGAFICLDPKLINLQSIVHEVKHAVTWLSALCAINGNEDEARQAGFMFEEVVAHLLREGWNFAKKDPEIAVFNTDLVGLALAAPEGYDPFTENA